MKNILLLLFLTIVTNNVYGAFPPVRTAGQGGTLEAVLNLYTPPNQVTSLGGPDKLIETGNDNILANPDFEGEVAGQSWTSATGALTRNSSEPLKGLYSLQVGLTAQTLNLSQTVASSSSVAGLQAEASIYVKASTAGTTLLFGPKIDGTESSTSTSITVGTTWQRVAVPFVTGSVSNGLFLKSSGNITNNISVDNASVKIGEVKNTSSVVTSWQSYTPTFTGFGTPTSVLFRWRQVGSSIEIEGEFTPSAVSGTVFNFGLPNSFTTSSTQLNNIPSGFFSWDAARGNPAYYTCYSWSETFVSFCEHPDAATYARIASAGPLPTAGNKMHVTAKVEIANLAGSVTSYSSSNGPSSLSFYDSSATNWSRTGTVTDQLYSTSGTTVNQVGTGLSYVNNSTDGFKVTANASGTMVFTVAVPLSNGTGIYFRRNGTQFTPSVTQNDGTNSPTGHSFTIFVNAGDYFTVNSTGLDTTRNIGFFVSLLPNGISGNFTNVWNTSGATGKRHYSAHVSASGTISEESDDFINGSCTNAHPSVCTFNTGIFSATPVCSGNNGDDRATMCSVYGETNSGFNIKCWTDGGVNDTVNTIKDIWCDGY